MPINPGQSPLTFTQVASSISALVYADDVNYSTNVQKFERREFSNVYLANLPESDGSEVVKVANITGKPIQIIYNCGVANLRNFAPDDGNIANILQRITYRRYQIKGAASSPTNIDSIYTLAQDHVRRYSVFESYLDQFSLKLSYTYISSLISQTFSYITTTGLSISGESINDSNLLIRNFSPGILYTNPTLGTIISKDWSCELWKINFIDSETIY